MSLYNALFGVNPQAGLLLCLLGKSHRTIPRFRDCFINDKDEIVIFTRTGGGNREDYEKENEELRKIPGFLYDKDDETDCTYAHFCYKWPEEHEEIKEVLKQEGGVDDIAKKWEAAFAALRKDKNDV